MIELLSIDLSNYCTKQCSFCYNHSSRQGNVMWKPREVVAFCTDCISHGVKAVSLGGGEPFEYEGVFHIIDDLYDKCYLSVTTNGLPLLDQNVWNGLLHHKPDKIHITIHHPDNNSEVGRVSEQVQKLKETDIKPGINLLVGADKTEPAKRVYENLRTILDAEQIIIIPQRLANTPTARQLADVAGGRPFQSPSCLLECKRPANFASVAWNKTVNSCSYAPHKEQLETLDYHGLQDALNRVRWASCQPFG